MSSNKIPRQQVCKQQQIAPGNQDAKCTYNYLMLVVVSMKVGVYVHVQCLCKAMSTTHHKHTVHVKIKVMLFGDICTHPHITNVSCVVIKVAC